MTDLGIPGVKKCGHTSPVFGCESCIESDRHAFAARAYQEWKKTYVLPKCPECHKRMSHDGMFRNDGRFCASVVCMSLNAEEGMALCGDQDIMVVIA